MTPFLRLSVSLSLTLLVWAPNAIDELGSGPVNLADLALRFVVTFAFFRASVRGVAYLLDSYRSSVPASKDVVPAASPSRAQMVERRTSRRRTDGAASAGAERELPALSDVR